MTVHSDKVNFKPQNIFFPNNVLAYLIYEGYAFFAARKIINLFDITKS